MEKIRVLRHSSIKLEGNQIIYIDPFQIQEALHDADYIFCTHSHHDHFSPEDIEKVRNKETKIITVSSAKEEVKQLFEPENIMIVEPGKEYQIDEILFKTTYAYNQNKEFHPKENGWVGYKITINDTTYFIAGDTDNIPELQNITCDIAFLPVGGTYTMDAKEAAELANTINAKIVVPTHYGAIVGEKKDAEIFEKLVRGKEVKILLEEE